MLKLHNFLLNALVDWRVSGTFFSVRGVLREISFSQFASPPYKSLFF